MKILVVHQGKRDEYQVATALAEGGHEVRLVTDGYGTKNIQLLSKLFPVKLLKKLSGRKAQSIVDAQVSSGLISEIFAKCVSFIFGESMGLELINKSIYKRAIKCLKKTRYDVVVCYNYNAFLVFNDRECASLYKVLFQCHPGPVFIKNEFDKFIESGVVPEKNNEKEFSYSPEYQAMLIAEPYISNSIICASSITRKSLTSVGISDEIITTIPYGVHTRFSVNKSNNKSENSKLNLIFVGQFSYRKGLVILSNILNKIDFEINMVFVGRGTREINPSDMISNNNVHTNTFWDVSNEKLVELYSEADVFIFPSLMEGFAHVVLEAMQAGCIPIVSENTCGPDVIEQGVNGFVYPAEDINSYVSTIYELAISKSLLSMQKAAQVKAKEYTWEKFRNKLCITVENIVCK